MENGTKGLCNLGGSHNKCRIQTSNPVPISQTPEILPYCALHRMVPPLLFVSGVITIFLCGLFFMQVNIKISIKSHGGVDGQVKGRLAGYRFLKLPSLAN